jgi:ABC-type lipoprotein release transport system permease subunit
MGARLAWRSLWRHRRRTIITVVSIGFGLALFVFSVSLADGMYARLIEDAVRMQAGHVTVEDVASRDAPAVDRRVRGVAALAARIEALPGVETTKRLVLGQGVARSGTGAAGVAVMGVEPDAEARTSPLARRLIAGRLRREYGDQPIPRPPGWTGLRVIPESIEFWTHREHRLHHRELFVRSRGRGWRRRLLQP